MSKVIIAVHGRGNKSASDLYTQSWKDAINEGLRVHHNYQLGDDVPFEMSYYSHIFFEEANNDLQYSPAAPGTIQNGVVA